MAKAAVDRAPYFDIDSCNYMDFMSFIGEYGPVDEKGRYLHWNLLKWRVPKENAKNIWYAVKFQRMLQMKQVGLLDEQDGRFSYFTSHAMEAKLHKVVKVAGGSVGAIGGSSTSDDIQQRFLVSSLIMEEAITSAQLEGAATTREDAKKMLEEEREPLDEDERMILNNFFLLKLAEKKSDEDLTLDLILDFHRVATQFTTENSVVPGEFRQGGDIYVEDDRGEVAYNPPTYLDIPKRLQALCDFANKDHSGAGGCEFIPPVIKAIILHFMIGYEHPFRDGNGRTARALFYWLMLKNHYELFRYVSISKHLKDNPKGYGLSYIYTEKDQNDLTYFIDFQLDVILTSFDELESYLGRKSDEFDQVSKLLDQSGFSAVLNFVQKDIVKKGSKEPGRIFKVKEISSSYDISDNTARSYLKQLLDLKLLLPTKEGRTKLYLAPADLAQRLQSNKA